MRRLRRAPAWLWDVLLTAALAGLAVVDLVGMEDPSLPVAAGLAAIVALPLVRRRHPLGTVVAWAAVTVVLFVALGAPDTLAVPFVGLLIFPYTAARVDGPRGLLALPAVWAATSANALAATDWVWGDIFFPGMFGTLFWLAGKAVRSRSRLTAELHEAAVRADEERESVAAQAMADERRRIAREMHDVVAHSVSMMVVQAGGARRILARDPARAVEAAALIERTGREALAEMRCLLGVLHAEDGHGPDGQQALHVRRLRADVDDARAQAEAAADDGVGAVRAAVGVDRGEQALVEPVEAPPPCAHPAGRWRKQQIERRGGAISSKSGCSSTSSPR